MHLDFVESIGMLTKESRQLQEERSGANAAIYTPDCLAREPPVSLLSLGTQVPGVWREVRALVMSSGPDCNAV